MSLNFDAHPVQLDSPLVSGELAIFAAVNHNFSQRPRALNCNAAGTLVVDMGALVQQPIYVVAGLNPYRVTRIYNAGSDVIGVMGMW